MKSVKKILNNLDKEITNQAKLKNKIFNEFEKQEKEKRGAK